MSIPVTEARSRLAKGDRLLRCLALDTWALADDGACLRHHVAERLLLDNDIALQPARDHLPGFPPECSQTWVSAVALPTATDHAAYGARSHGRV